MPLNLYRRHRSDCAGGHAEDSRSGELEERSKKWKRCQCQIYAAGTLKGRFRRRRTGKWEWDDAKSVAAAWEAAGSWDASGDSPLPAGSAPSAEQQQSMTIAAATQAYLDNRRSRELKAPTLSKYNTLVKQFVEFCDGRGYVCLQQLTVVDMDRFYASWKDGKRSKAKKLERLKGFIKFAVKRKWLTENIVEDLEAPEGSSLAADRVPFTDEELDRIYAACDRLGGLTPPGPGHREWSGEDVKDFIMLSVYTGLRISDVSTFDIRRRLNGNEVHLRMHKTGKPLWTWIPDWLVERLRARESKYGALIFHDIGNRWSTNMRSMAEVWRVKQAKVFELAGSFETPPTPHRFRHTFVRVLLEKGVPVADVAELIGDTEATVRKHYAKWVRERQVRLTNILKEAFSERLRPDNVVEMPMTSTKETNAPGEITSLGAFVYLSGSIVFDGCGKAIVNADGDRGRNGIAAHALLAAEPDADHARFVFDEEPDGLTADLPLPGQVRDAEVIFKC